MINLYQTKQSKLWFLTNFRNQRCLELISDGQRLFKAAKAAYKAAGKKAKGCAKLREDGLAIEAGENDTLIVNKLSADPDMFGLFGYSYLIANKDKIKATAVNGVKPSLKGIQDYSYPIARPLFFYEKAHIGVVPGIHEYIKEFTANKSVGSKGYLTDITSTFKFW